MNQKDWEPIRWHCPNCGTLAVGYKNESNEVRITCSKCRCNMVFTKSKKYRNVKIFRPEY